MKVQRRMNNKLEKVQRRIINKLDRVYEWINKLEVSDKDIMVEFYT